MNLSLQSITGWNYNQRLGLWELVCLNVTRVFNGGPNQSFDLVEHEWTLTEGNLTAHCSAHYCHLVLGLNEDVSSLGV